MASEEGEIFGQEPDTGLGKFIRQSFIIVVYINGHFRLRNDRSGIHSLVHDYQGDTGFAILVFDRFTSAKRPAILGKKGEVEVKGADGWCEEPTVGDDFTVTDDEKEIGL